MQVLITDNLCAFHQEFPYHVTTSGEVGNIMPGVTTSRMASDPLYEAARRAIRSLPGVSPRMRRRMEEDVLVLSVEGDNLTEETIFRISELEWELMDAHPGRYLHVELHDNFGRG